MKRKRRKVALTIFGISIPLLLLFLSQLAGTAMDIASLFFNFTPPAWMIGVTSLLFIIATLLLWISGGGE